MKVSGGLIEHQTMGSLHHNSFRFVVSEHNNQKLMICLIRRAVVSFLRAKQTK
jgi:hypothetical protein